MIYISNMNRTFVIQTSKIHKELGSKIITKGEDMSYYIDDILYEFRGEEKSFLINIRCNLKWSHESFLKLINTMILFCTSRESEERLDKEIAEGFWFVSWYIKEWTSHENFRKINDFSSEYFNQAYIIIHFLAYWYFIQDCPFTSEDAFDDEINELEKLKNI